MTILQQKIAVLDNDDEVEEQVYSLFVLQERMMNVLTKLYCWIFLTY